MDTLTWLFARPVSDEIAGFRLGAALASGNSTQEGCRG
jgi:hypothetical protein